MWLTYFNEEKRTNQPTETTRTLSDLRSRHRRALLDVILVLVGATRHTRSGNITPSKPSNMVMAGTSYYARRSDISWEQLVRTRLFRYLRARNKTFVMTAWTHALGRGNFGSLR